MSRIGNRFRIRTALAINPEDPINLLVDSELLSDALCEGDIITLGSKEEPARDWTTGNQIPWDQRFRVVRKK